jgi:hypothetical protein
MHLKYTEDETPILFTSDATAVVRVLTGSTIRLAKTLERVDKRFGIELKPRIADFMQRFRAYYGGS